MIEASRAAVERGAIWVGVLDIDDGEQVLGITGDLSAGYLQVRVLVLKHGTPVGCVSVPAWPLESLAERVRAAALTNLAGPLLVHAQRDAGADQAAGPLDWVTQAACRRRFRADGMGVTVIVCTRDRSNLLLECLRSLQHVRHDPLEILIVDNAPSGEQTREVVTAVGRDDPRVRYLREPRPGLSRARNRGLAEARYDIVAFTDDDVLADPGWPSAVAAGFAADPEAACVTGLVMSGALETVSERYFDGRYPWGEAFEPRRYDMTANRPPSRLYPFAAGQFGTGANFAVRRSAVTRFGEFDPLLGAGGPGQGGEDLDWFVRVIRAGGRICYLPSAFVWHRHRSDAHALSRQIYSYGHGLGAYLAKHLAEREFQVAILGHGWHQAGRLLGRMQQASRTSQLGARSWQLAAAEMRGLAAGMVCYTRAARRAVSGSGSSRSRL